ncbi:MAG: adenylyltransferase/cytidyltransferase family protein [Patescibacteria group bacterium]|jgi:FAD synthetase
MNKVMIFGTFDGLHPGHLNFFEQARKFGDKLIVVVARDKNVKKVKGRLPKLGDKQRLMKVNKAIKQYSNKAVLGGLGDPLAVIRKFKPDVICLGYDQKGFTKGLVGKFPKIKIVRLKPYKADIYKSSRINKEL